MPTIAVKMIFVQICLHVSFMSTDMSAIRPVSQALTDHELNEPQALTESLSNWGSRPGTGEMMVNKADSLSTLLHLQLTEDTDNKQRNKSS